MKNKKIVISIIILILVIIGIIFGWNYYKLKNDVFIKPYELSDDVKFVLYNPDINNYIGAVQFQLDQKYSLRLEAIADGSVILTENLGTINGKGKYYYVFSNDGNKIKFYDYCINEEKKTTINSSTKWVEIPYELADNGRFEPKRDSINMKNDKNFIGGINWSNDKKIVKIRIYASKIK